MSDYGHGGQTLTYGELFGGGVQPYGNFGAGTSTAAGGKDRPKPVVYWLRALSAPQKPAYGSVAGYEVILPMTSHRPLTRPVTPLPCPTTCWNDEQDLADILRLLGMT
jgi:hypothetical protein